jgi:hypothetical protein
LIFFGGKNCQVVVYYVPNGSQKYKRMLNFLRTFVAKFILWMNATSATSLVAIDE